MVSRNKILIVGSPKSGKLTFINSIFQSIPDIDNPESHSGIIHDVDLKTKYYTKKLQIWIDEFTQEEKNGGVKDNIKTKSPASELELLTNWSQEFKTSEYKEIRDVISGIIFCFDLGRSPFKNDKEVESYAKEVVSILDIFKEDETANKKLVSQMSKVNIKESTEQEDSDDDNLDTHYDIWQGFSMIVGFERENCDPNLQADILKEIFWDNDLDFVNYKQGDTIDVHARDEYGDRMGLGKAKDIIECFDWNDIELKVPDADHKYDTEYIDSMKVPLNKDDEQKEEKPIEVGLLVDKIKNAKENVNNLESTEAREKFAREFINDIMKYL